MRISCCCSCCCCCRCCCCCSRSMHTKVATGSQRCCNCKYSCKSRSLQAARSAPVAADAAVMLQLSILMMRMSLAKR
jgi:hypothetical protein